MTMIYANTNAISPILQASEVEPFAFRVGIDYGPVTVSRLGAAKRFGALVAVGTTANIASKMLGVAKPGDIVLGDMVRSGLPASWHQYCVPTAEPSGWSYSARGIEYPFFRYIGRWTKAI